VSGHHKGKEGVRSGGEKKFSRQNKKGKGEGQRPEYETSQRPEFEKGRRSLRPDEDGEKKWRAECRGQK
jgi:hypothetical protein